LLLVQLGRPALDLAEVRRCNRWGGAADHGGGLDPLVLIAVRLVVVACLSPVKFITHCQQRTYADG